MTTDFPDYNEPAATALAIGGTNLVGTGLAREAGGNLDTHTRLLNGTQAGALVANAGLTVGQELAALIASGSATGVAGGAPLLAGARQVLSVGSQAILPTASFTPALITFTRPGYLIRITANMGAGVAGIPYAKCDLEWQVAAQGNVDCWEDVWYIPGGNNTNLRTNGRGPVLGDTLKLTVTNGDSINTMTVNITIWETTHAPARSDWRSSDCNPSAAGTKASNRTLANFLADINSNIPASTTTQQNLPLYAGQVNLWLNQNTGAGSLVTINPVGGYDLPNGEAIITIDWTAVANTYEGIILPRCPCSLTFKNGAAIVKPALLTLTALEYAS